MKTTGTKMTAFATFADLKEETKSFIPEGQSSTYTATQLKVFINNALREHAMSGEWWWFRTSEDINVSANTVSVDYDDLKF